ncbi:hypothetical protein D9M72_609230 [compost metagenome]
MTHDLGDHTCRDLQPLGEALERATQAVQRESFQVRGSACVGHPPIRIGEVGFFLHRAGENVLIDAGEGG